MILNISMALCLYFLAHLSKGMYNCEFTLKTGPKNTLTLPNSTPLPTMLVLGVYKLLVPAEHYIHISLTSLEST